MVITITVAVMCVSYFEIEDDATLHAIVAIALLAVLALKVVVVRWWHRMGASCP